ncbi:monocarboxylate transporter [Colletotrichum higginsianum]|uniref:Monocarboxylate transporter n=1 Tax=Colletotrichum higginsianum (strain IMI 349063) TaxID=759273 RepID=H1V080_COLHI|nr:Monocarboxylate transporter [Colletotrichum higginsianum IMI 349063]OBR14711.1 Monocarboxylate transporter [Colletotrichum higginsianum IMI 349063]CCF33631.1 monocarboxylate transporter [Colletotrichum higginsianum]
MSVELRRLPDADARAASAQQTDEEDVNTLIQTMPPTDKGAAAWKFLLSSFVIEALLWGFPLTFGVFQEYYSSQPQFKDDPNIAIIGTVSTSIYFLGAPLAAPLVKRFHLYQRHMVVVGWALCVASLVGASFADSVPGLIATQGVLYGFGFLMLYFPVLRMLNEWFVARRGLAYGVLYAGGGFSGVGLPFLLQLLLSRYGYRTTLRAVAVAQFACVAPVLHMVKGRLPPSPRGAMRMFDVSFLRQPLFYCFALSNLFQGFAYYIPSLYLPSYASAIGLSGTMGALLLAAHNLATVFGQLGFGWLSDRTDNVFALMFVSSFVSSVAAFTLWGFAHSLALLVVFALVFGMFAGGFLIFWAKFGAMLSDDPQPVFSMMAFGKGIGNLATGPITAGLLTKPVSWGYGMGRYESLILFLGSFMLCSSLGAFAWPLKKR